jgi:hypothetical protein
VVDAPARRHASHEHHPEATAAAEVRRPQARVDLHAGVAQLHAQAPAGPADAQVDLAVLPHAAVTHAVGDDLGDQQLQVAEQLRGQRRSQPLSEGTASVPGGLLTAGDDDPEFRGAGHWAAGRYTIRRAS